PHERDAAGIHAGADAVLEEVEQLAVRVFSHAGELATAPASLLDPAAMPLPVASTAEVRRRPIVALDVPDARAAVAAAQALRGHVGMLKVGLELFVAEGPEVVRRLRAEVPELEIFLDLKLHDIPNTMRGAIRSARSLGCRFITVHAGSGLAHLRACVAEAGPDLGVLAVTVLTSQDAAACAEA